MPNPLGPGVSRYVDGRDKQLAAVVWESTRPPLDSELNLFGLMELEARAEAVRSTFPSGWLLNESNPREDFNTDPDRSNFFYFGRNTSGETRNPVWAIVNGWVIPVTGTNTGAPPLAPNNVDTHNKILLNPSNNSVGGNKAEFAFLEVWLQRIDVDPAPPTVSPGKPQRGFLYRFGNVEGGFSYLADDLIDPDINYETTKRVQIQYRIRTVPNVSISQYPEGFDSTLVFAQGALSAPSALCFTNMRNELGDPGLWRAGTGDPAILGTVDGYVYAIPICAVFRRNSAGFSDVGNIAGAFDRNSVAITRNDATEFTSGISLPAVFAEVDTQFTLASITGTVLSTINSYGEAYFRIDDEIIRINSVVQVGLNYVVTVDRGQLQTTIRAHNIGTELTLYTVRPDGLFSDQVTLTDILDLRHSIADKFDYDSILRTNLIELLRGNLRTTWKRFGSTFSAGPVVFYGDRVTDSTIFVGGLSRLDGPSGNRRTWSDSVITERYSAAVQVPGNGSSVTDPLQVAIAPYNINVLWNTAAPGRGPGSRLNGAAPWWWNGDKIQINIAEFRAGLPVTDSDQVRFILPSEDPDAILIHFEGMTTDPNGGVPFSTTTPTASNPNTPIAGNRILKNGQGIAVSLDGSGNLIIELNSDATIPPVVPATPFQEFGDAVPVIALDTAVSTVMHVEFAVVYGAGRGLSHKPDYIHTAHYRGDPTNSSKVMLRPGLSDRSRLIPTYLNESPCIQTGTNRNLSRTSDMMVDPGSKTIHIAPYRNILVPAVVFRDGNRLNWDPMGNYWGAMPTRDQSGINVVHTTVDPLSLFWNGPGATVYAEIPLNFLPKPGLHHVPIIPVTNAIFPSGINFVLMSKEGPFGASNSSDWNRGLVSYPAATPGYYIVTPVVGETYGTGALPSIFGKKYTNNKLRSVNGGPFKGIQFPPFYAPARITGVYKRSIPALVPTSSPFNLDRVFVGGVGTDVNLLRDDFDGPTFLLDVDVNGDLYFILNSDVIDLTKSTPGTTFDNSEFLIECTLFGFDRGFLETNGRVLNTRDWIIAANDFIDTSDSRVGVIAPAPLSLYATNNEVTIYYSRQPYQGDVFGSQNAYSDDVQRLGPLAISEATSLKLNPLGPVSTLSMPNKVGYEVLTATNFVTSLGTGRLSGSVPIKLLNTVENPNGAPDYTGTLPDLNRRFSLNRVGFEDWVTPKFPVTDASVLTRPSIKRGAMSEIFDRDMNTEFAGCVSHLPLGSYFRDKDFIGKTLYQTRSTSNIGMITQGAISFPPYQAPANPATAGNSTWEGTEFICGQTNGASGAGGEVIIKVDGTSSFSDITKFKTARGGAGWSLTEPWPGGAISSRLPKARPNSEVGSVLVGTAYLVRSQPELFNNIEVHPGHELQMVIVTQATPAYFRDTDILHSANGTNEGFTALDRFRIWGRPIEKRRAQLDVSTATLTDKPLFVNNIYDDPIFYGSSDMNLASLKQELLPITVNGQTVFTLSNRPIDPTTVMLFVRGVKLVYGIDYTVGGITDQTVTYIVSGSNPPLLTTDTLEAWFMLL